MNWLARLRKRRRRLSVYQSFDIIGKIRYAQVIYVIDADLHQRGEFVFYLN